MNIADAFNLTKPLGYEERKMENKTMADDDRNERIGDLTREYLNDVGTFFEWIQGIEVSEDDNNFYNNFHYNIIQGRKVTVWLYIHKLFSTYCERKAIKEIDDELS